MEREFVPYTEALELKELGFDEPCFGFHSKIHGLMMVKTSGSSSLYKDAGECLAPTYSQAFRWFRDEHSLKSWVEEHTINTFIYEIRPHVLSDYKEGEIYVYDTHEETELACLTKLIEIVEQKQKP